MSITHRVRVAVVAALGAIMPMTAHPQAIIKVNDSTSIRFGFLGQMWADFQQNVRQDTSFAQSIFFRRMRFIASAQVGSKLSIFFQTDDPNLGRAAPGINKNLAGATNGQGFIIQDAYLELKPASAPFWIEGGLLLIPLCRNCYASAASLLPIDYGAYSFLASGPTGSVAGRDGGVMAKGTFADQHVEYRAGLFTGARSTVGAVTTASNSFRGAGHLMVNFLEPEAPGYVLPGTYLGRRKVFNVGAGFDVQSVYKAFAADAFLSYPFGPDGVTLSGNFIHYDGSTFFPTLPKESTFEVEGGYHLTEAKITPWVKWETRNIDAAAQTAALQNEHRLQVGGTYYWVGQTLNVKAGYNRYTFKVLNASDLTQNGFTVQLQAFYY